MTTTTTVTVTSASASSARIVASVTGSSAPSGTVAFFEGATQLASGVPLTSGQAVRIQTANPGAHTYRAVFTPAANTPFTSSEGTGSGTVQKATSSLSASFPKTVKFGKKAKGTVTVTLNGSSSKATGTVTIKDGSKVVGTGTLANGKVTITLKKPLKPGKHKLTISWAGDANAAGSETTVKIKALAKPKKKLAPAPPPARAGAPSPAPARPGTQPLTSEREPPMNATPAAGHRPAPRRTSGSRSRHVQNGLAELRAVDITAWFGTHKVLDRVSLTMPAGGITALIGPSGCGKSTFLRILNRMHELVPSAALAGEVLLDGEDIYDPSRKLIDARRAIGMVFQKPNPFPAMSIRENVLAGLKLTGTRASRSEKEALVESCLHKGGLWQEVKDRLDAPGGSLSGGQQQRLCIARSLAVKPRVLLMDEPCSALDPTSTRVIEETMVELAHEVTIVIVTHNMQQAARVSDTCAFFLASQGTPGVIVEHGQTDAMFGSPQDQRTADYVNGRFG